MIRLLILLGVFIGTTMISRANSASIVPLFVKDVGEIVSFTNGLPPSTGTRKVLTKEQMLAFLKAGAYVWDLSKWHDLVNPINAYEPPVCDGVFVDKSGKFYFWSLRSPTVLKIETPQGEAAVIQLHP